MKFQLDVKWAGENIARSVNRNDRNSELQALWKNQNAEDVIDATHACSNHACTSNPSEKLMRVFYAFVLDPLSGGTWVS